MGRWSDKRFAPHKPHGENAFTDRETGLTFIVRGGSSSGIDLYVPPERWSSFATATGKEFMPANGQVPAHDILSVEERCKTAGEQRDAVFRRLEEIGLKVGRSTKIAVAALAQHAAKSQAI